MAVLDPTRIYDGWANLAGGVDDGRLPNLIDENQCFEAQNAIFRGGAPTNRLPLIDVALNYDNPNVTYDLNGDFVATDGTVGASRIAFQTGTFQEASYFGQAPGKEFIMVSVGGRQWRFKPDIGQNCVVREIELERRNSQKRTIAYHVQAGSTYHITQDGEGFPIIFDGLTSRRATVGEIPIGLMMGQGQGRIVLVDKFGNILFGDIFDGHGNADTDMLGFEETLFLAEGFPTRLPGSMGFPTAIQFIPQQDTATGVGPCLIYGQNGVAAVDLSISRELWKDSPFQRDALLAIGNAGHRSVTIINEDCWFRAPKDGWRSFRQARAEINQWSQIPMSTNVRRWVDSEEKSLLRYCSAIAFNDRLIVTVNPYPNQGRVYHNGLLALDFDVISTFGKTTNPAWDGHWSNADLNYLDGMKITRLVEGTFDGTSRAFAFYIDQFGHNALREIMPVPRGGDTGKRITSWVDTRSLDFQKPFNEKLLYGGDVWIDQVTETTDVTVSYRPDQVPDLNPWQTLTVDSVGTPNAITPGMVPTIAKGFSPRKALKKPPDIGDPLNTKRIMRRGYEFQTRIQWTGRARIRKFRMHGKELVEDSKAKIE